MALDKASLAATGDGSVGSAEQDQTALISRLILLYILIKLNARERQANSLDLTKLQILESSKMNEFADDDS